MLPGYRGGEGGRGRHQACATHSLLSHRLDAVTVNGRIWGKAKERTVQSSAGKPLFLQLWERHAHLPTPLSGLSLSLHPSLPAPIPYARPNPFKNTLLPTQLCWSLARGVTFKRMETKCSADRLCGIALAFHKSSCHSGLFLALFLMIRLLLEIRGFLYSKKLNLKPLLTLTGREQFSPVPVSCPSGLN